MSKLSGSYLQLATNLCELLVSHWSVNQWLFVRIQDIVLPAFEKLTKSVCCPVMFSKLTKLRAVQHQAAFFFIAGSNIIQICCWQWYLPHAFTVGYLTKQVVDNVVR